MQIITAKKAVGLAVAALGIGWYSAIQMRPAPPALKSPPASPKASLASSAGSAADQPLLTPPQRKSSDQRKNSE